MTGMVMIGFMLVAAIVSGSLACSCEGPITFCSNAYAAVIEVKDSGTIVGSSRIYRIKVVNIVYHGTPLSNGQLDRKQLKVWGVGTSCEIQLLSKGYYALTGYLSNPTGTPPRAIMGTGGCDLIRRIDNRREAKSFQFPDCPIPVEPVEPVESVPV